MYDLCMKSVKYINRTLLKSVKREVPWNPTPKRARFSTFFCPPLKNLVKKASEITINVQEFCHFYKKFLKSDFFLKKNRSARIPISDSGIFNNYHNRDA